MKSNAFASLLIRLRALRKAHDLTQEGFAELAGMSYKYYQAVEGGQKVGIRLSTLEKLAAAYGIELWELLAPPMPQVHLSAALKRKRAPKGQTSQGHERRKITPERLRQATTKQTEAKPRRSRVKSPDEMF